jgi:murein L,D-transpeptidase YafK
MSGIWSMGFFFAVAGAVALALAPEAGGKGRVAAARENKGETVTKLVTDAGLSYPPYQVLIRAYKKEGEIEVWARSKNDAAFVKVKTYPVCYMSGGLGPKRREGDLQVPEGIYKITVFNPASSFHLSLGTDYPNASDRVLGDPQKPGGEIFIHGNCVSIGCIAIEDDPIEEVYLMSLDSKTKFGRAPAVHIFPCRMDQPECRQELKDLGDAGAGAPSLWEDLAAIHAAFDGDHKIPNIKIDGKGRYVIEP